MDWSRATLGTADGALFWVRLHRAEGDVVQAGERAAQAMEYATDPEQPLALIGIHRLLGTQAFASRDIETARRHLRLSLELADECRNPFERALTQLALGELHAATGEIDDARSQLDECVTICTRLGARPTLERARALAKRLEIRMDHSRSPFSLTPRELEVLRLLAEGKSDREIAEALFISHHTVMNHVSRILGKLDVGSRTAAAAYALRHDLV
jgi:DNA-binding CsgD family transcriptional regulator